MISFSMISWSYLNTFANLAGSCLASVCEPNWLARTCGHVTARLPPSRTPPPSPSLHKSELHRDEVCSICLKLVDRSCLLWVDLTLNYINSVLERWPFPLPSIVYLLQPAKTKRAKAFQITTKHVKGTALVAGCATFTFATLHFNPESGIENIHRFRFMSKYIFF